MQHWWLHACALLVLSLAVLYIPLRQGRWWAWLVLPVVASVSFAIAWLDAALLALYIPPIVLNATAGWFFARTLLPGKQALITNVAEQIRGDMPPAIARYTRNLTWMWAGLLWCLALTNALLALFAPPEVWSVFANVINYLLVGLMFPLEYLYRFWRYNDYWHPTIWQFIRGLMRIDWKRL